MRISDWSSDVCSSDLIGVTWPQKGDLRRDALVAGQPGAGCSAISRSACSQVSTSGVSSTSSEAGAGRRPRPWRSAWRFDQLKRSEEHTSELQSLMRISYAVFCVKKKTKI